jgi:low affinity Fe/Cu permease
MRVTHTVAVVMAVAVTVTVAVTVVATTEMVSMLNAKIRSMEEKKKESIVGVRFTQLRAVRSNHRVVRKERESREKDKDKGRKCCCHLRHLHRYLQCVA